jgi:transposase
MAYSMDLRSRVVAARDAGESTPVVAKRFGVSVAWVRRLTQRRRELGSIERKRGIPGRKPKLAAHQSTLRGLVSQKPDATLDELRKSLPVRVSISTLWLALQVLKLSFKKSASCQ